MEVIFVAWQIGQLPEAGYEVENLLGIAGSLGSNQQQNSYSSINQIISRLNGLRNTVQAQEKNFLTNFPGSSPQEKLAAFQAEIDRYVNQVNFLINGNPEFRATQADMVEKLKKPIEMVIHNKTFKRELIDRLEAGETSASLVMDALESIRNSPGSGITTTFIRTRKGKSIGLQKQIEDLGTISYSNGKIRVSLNSGFPSTFEKRLKNEYKVIEEGDDTINNIKNAIQSLRQRIASAAIEGTLKQNLQSELELYENSLTQSNQRYSLNSSMASVAGFLGEIAYTSILNTIFNTHGIPVGTMRKIIHKNGRTITNGEIPIDLIVNGTGFQIKNYSVINNSATFGHRSINDSMRLGNFITERARVGGTLEDILMTLFGSFQYNQDITGNFVQRSSLEATAYATTDFFEGYVDNILKVSDQFQANSAPFLNPNLYFNSFFIVQNRVVPSSAILQTIINQLNSKQDQIIKSSFILKDPSGGLVYTGLHYDHHLGTEYVKKAANCVTINYKITLDLNQVIANF